MRPRWMLAAFIGLQLLLPTIGLWLRWFAGQDAARWAWHMFSAAP